MDRKKLIGIVITVIAAVAGTFIGRAVIDNTGLFNKGFDSQLVAVASEINKKCPMTIDAETRLDTTVALPGNKFQYMYTLVNFKKDQIDVDTLKKTMRPSILNTIKTNPDLKTFRDNNVTMIYNYRDKNGVTVMQLEYMSSDYKSE